MIPSFPTQKNILHDIIYLSLYIIYTVSKHLYTHQMGHQRSLAVPAHAGKVPVGRDPEGRASAGMASEGRDQVQSLDRLEGSLAGRSQLLVGKTPL